MQRTFAASRLVPEFRDFRSCDCRGSRTAELLVCGCLILRSTSGRSSLDAGVFSRTYDANDELQIQFQVR